MSKFLKFSPILLLLSLFASLSLTPGAQAQTSFQWSIPKRIPNYGAQSRPPFLVADRNHGIHAFNYEAAGLGQGAIYYRSWNIEQGWSPPVDIIIPVQGSGSATLQGAALDNRGIIHLIYYDGNEQIGDIFYTWAYASVADRAKSWSKPVPVGANAGPVVYAALIVSDDGILHILYGGQQDGIGLYQVYSTDYGANWSATKSVSLVNEKLKWPFSIKLAFDKQGRLHAVWSLMTDRGVGAEVRYARMDSPGNWSHETLLATRDGIEYSTTWPTIVVREEEVIVVYQDSFPATKWMAYSNNSGESWAVPVRPFAEIGEYENVVLLKDSRENIYMLLGNRTTDPEIHGMWLSNWLGNQWSALEPIISGPKSPTFDPSAPQGVILQGNLLMITWWHDATTANRSGAWYSYTYLNAPELPIQPLPRPSAEPTQVIELTNTPTQSALTATAPVQPTFETSYEPEVNPSLPVYLGLLPVLAIISLVVILRSINQKPR